MPKIQGNASRNKVARRRLLELHRVVFLLKIRYAYPVSIAELVTNPKQAEVKAKALELELITRGRKAAKQFHQTKRLHQGFRNVGFRIGNLFIRRLSRRAAASEQRR